MAAARAASFGARPSLGTSALMAQLIFFSAPRKRGLGAFPGSAHLSLSEPQLVRVRNPDHALSCYWRRSSLPLPLPRRSPCPLDHTEAGATPWTGSALARRGPVLFHLRPPLTAVFLTTKCSCPKYNFDFVFDLSCQSNLGCFEPMTSMAS